MTSAMTALELAFLVRNFLVTLILSSFSMASLHFILMCTLKFSVKSRKALRYLVMWLLGIISPFIFIWVIIHFWSCLGPPKYMNSILLSFIFSHIASTQNLMFSIDFSMIAMVLSSCWWSSWLGLKVFLMLWSFSNPHNVRSFTLSSSVEA